MDVADKGGASEGLVSPLLPKAIFPTPDHKKDNSKKAQRPIEHRDDPMAIQPPLLRGGRCSFERG